MAYKFSSSELYYSPLYRKAKEIIHLTRNISDYLIPEMAVLNERETEDSKIYFTGDIIRQSLSLIPNIENAEKANLSDSKLNYAATVGRLTDILYKNCERLELSSCNGTDFVKHLRRELKKFRKLQYVWKLSL